MPRRAAAVEAAKNISNINEEDNDLDDTKVECSQKNDARTEEMEEDEKIDELCSITGSSKEVASNLLSACNGSLNMAIDMFTEETDNATTNNLKKNKSVGKYKNKKNRDNNITSKENRKEDSESDWENHSEASKSATSSSESSNESETEFNNIESETKKPQRNGRKRHKANQSEEEELFSDEDETNSEGSSTERSVKQQNRSKRLKQSNRKNKRLDSNKKQRNYSCSSEDSDIDLDDKDHNSDESSEDMSEDEESDNSSLNLSPSGTKSRPQRSKTVRKLTDIVMSEMSEEKSSSYKLKTKRKGKSKAFSGKGHILGGQDSVSMELPTPKIDPGVDLIQKAQDELKVDDSIEKTTIQLRFPDGQSIKLNLNQIHTVGHLKKFVSTAKPELSVKKFTLRTSFPNRELNEDNVTIKDGGLIGAAMFFKFL